MVGCGAVMDVASLIHWPIFLPINLLPSSYSSTHNTGRYHGPHVLGGGFPHPCFVSYVRATTQTAIHSQRLPIPEHNMVDLHAHKYGRFMPSQLTRSVSTQIIPVGIFFAHPVGVFLLKPGRDYLLLYFIIPTGIILVRTKLTRPGLSSFEKIAPTGFLSCPSLHTFPFLHAAVTPLSTHHQLQGCTGYTLLHSTFPELALFRILACIQHEIPVGFLLILTGIIFHCLFTPTGVINTPILM